MESNISNEEFNKLIKRLEFCDTTRNNLLSFSFTAVLAILGLTINATMDKISSWICLLPYLLIIPFSARISYYRLSSAHINSFLRIFAEDKMKFELGTSLVPEKIFNGYRLISWLVNHEMVLLGVISSLVFGIKYWNCVEVWSAWDCLSLVFAFILIFVVYYITDLTNDYKKLISDYSIKWRMYDIRHAANYMQNNRTKKRKNQIWIWVKANCALVITTIFAVIMFSLWLISTNEHKFSDLWLNLLAGFISSIITIAVIDNIVKKQKERNEKPFRLALYRDIQLLASRFINLWQEMYIQSNVDRTNIPITELFETEKIDSIYKTLDLEGYPNVIPKQDWFTYIDETSKDLINRGNRILDRYVAVAEPELFQAIHHLINDSPFVGLLGTIKGLRLVDLANNIPRHPLLKCYVIAPTDNDFYAIRTLLTWCQGEYDKLKETDAVHKIIDRIAIINPNTPPTSIMGEEKYQTISHAIDVWHQAKPEIK